MYPLLGNIIFSHKFGLALIRGGFWHSFSDQMFIEVKRERGDKDKEIDLLYSVEKFTFLFQVNQYS